ncbi:MAG: peptide chain release factor N(5)-glutamine methyltransferase [Proteobacteria bacterium]|nr:peptide chain release factor N(5)-glutamine methyltransferase [Pseudomonadota bacterium]
MSQTQYQSIIKLIRQVKQGKPLAYILGHKEFWSLKLTVNPNTLIPRPETETIIELALNLSTPPKTILDLGTGSGAIAVALALEFPRSQITATDISKEALKIARLNAKHHKLTNIEFVPGSWFDPIKTPKKFELIVSNPPYVAENDKHLPQLKYEPVQALVSKNKGLADIEKIIKTAFNYLNPDSHIMIEHGYQQKQAVQSLLHQYQYTNIKTTKDLAGLDRISQANRPH